MNTSTRAGMLYDANKKSLLIAYLLWWFLGYLGVHRLYLGRVLSGLLMLVVFTVSLLLTLVLIGYIGLALIAVWWLVDALLIPGMARAHNMALISRLT